MSGSKKHYYILFVDYTQGLALHELLRNHQLRARIAPTPRSIQGELSCGMSLLIEPEDIDEVRGFLECSGAEYHRIAELEDQLRPGRNKFC